MTDQEQRDKEAADFKVWSKVRVAELNEHFKTNPPKDGKYWHLRIEHVALSNCAKDSGTMVEWDLDYMKLCIECLEHCKQVSPAVLKHWCSYWSCFVMDTRGEAHCKIGTKYYPQYGALAVGEEKRQYEEIIELSHRFYDLYPKEEKS